MKSLLNVRRFINRRNVCNEQALTAEVIYNDARVENESQLKASGAICSGAWREKFPISSADLEHSRRSRFLLMLQARDFKFLEHSIFTKKSRQVTKSC